MRQVTALFMALCHVQYCLLITPIQQLFCPHARTPAQMHPCRMLIKKNLHRNACAATRTHRGGEHKTIAQRVTSVWNGPTPFSASELLCKAGTLLVCQPLNANSLTLFLSPLHRFPFLARRESDSTQERETFRDHNRFARLQALCITRIRFSRRGSISTKKSLSVCMKVRKCVSTSQPGSLLSTNTGPTAHSSTVSLIFASF